MVLRRTTLVVSMMLGCGQAEDSARETGGGETEADTEAGSSSMPSTNGETDPTQASSTRPGTDSGSTTATDPTGGPPPELVEVGHPREFRAAWVATVNNINFPSAQGLPVETMQEELSGYIDTLVATNMNAIVFQVRPECDAYYASDLEPWSRYLTGTQGVDPGFDPLDYLLTEAQASGIEVHAWLNPYRAAYNANIPVVPPHVALAYPEYAYVYGTHLWMDPAAEPVREHHVDVIVDLVDRYDIDGIHFDDYFYPYRNAGDFPDDETYAAYLGSGGTLGVADWRRDNVNTLVQLLGEEIAAAKPWVRFGISPFGIYQPGMPPGIEGLNQYEALYADPVKWIQEGWVDYLAPQLYWPTTQTAQSYELLIEWWVSVAPPGYNIFTGNFLSLLGSSDAWTVDEILTQVELSRMYQLDSPGNIFFHIEPLQTNQAGIADLLRDEFYTQPVLTPALWAHRDDVVDPPVVTLDGTTATLEPGSDEPLRAWVVYRDDGAGFVLDRIEHGIPQTVSLAPGRWAISAAARTGAESQGVVVEL